MTSHAPFRILFLCTGNSARSILAEHLTRSLFSDRFDPVSAGSDPKPEPHPDALAVLREDFGIDPSDARSKSLDEFRNTHFDFVITLCDDAKEKCPVWPGQPVLAHWGMKDPSDAPEGERRKAFLEAAHLIRRRMELLASLPFDKLDRLRLELETRSIGSTC